MFANNYQPQETLSFDVSLIVEEKGWMAFSSTGILAGARLQLDLSASVEVDTSTFGTAVVNFDFKLRNPNYDPPDPIGGGIIPGFTWFVAIPALIGAAAVGLIIRKRK